jgi:sugar/nucleoside kinase (ribokinase family)
MDPSVLVVGATNVDVLADYDARHAGTVDRPGTVTYGVGGSAYNVAANLAENGVQTALYTVVREESPFADRLLGAVRKRGIDDRYVRVESGVPESAFVALREAGDVAAAVTATPFDSVTLDVDAVREAVARARVVVADCNLTRSQLCTVTDAAAAAGRPTLVLGVSEPKATRALGLDGRIDALFVTESEAEAAFDGTSGTDLRPGAYGLDRVVVTRGAAGFRVVTDDGATTYPAPSVSDVATTTGAGDALVSGLVRDALADSTGDIDVERALPTIRAHVRAVLRREQSTTGDLDAPPE